jgi:murein L,D-transpeptidase YafK
MMPRPSLILAHTLILFLCIGTPPVPILAWPHDALPSIDKVVVVKHERTLQLLSNGKVVKAYKVALGSEPVGAKQRQGDHRTPEGMYVLDSRNAHSRFYKAIHISYPSPQDKIRAAATHVSPGGDVYLHGLPNGYGAVGAAHRLRDWTDGCIAVTDSEIDEIWSLVKNGTPIEIKP